MIKSTHRIEDKDLESSSVAKELEAAEKSLKKEGKSTKASTKTNKKKSDSKWGSLTSAVTKKLEAAGHKSLEDLKDMDLKALQAIDGIGKVSAKKILGEL